MRQKSCANQEDSWTYIILYTMEFIALCVSGHKVVPLVYTRAYLKHRSFLQDRVKVRWCWLKFVGTSLVAGEREAEEKEREGERQERRCCSPIVDMNVVLNVSSAYLNRTHVFPTPLSPIRSSLKRRSYAFLGTTC